MCVCVCEETLVATHEILDCFEACAAILYPSLCVCIHICV